MGWQKMSITKAELDLLCPKCNQLNRIEAEYCRLCGTKFTDDEDYDVELETVPLIQCPHCSKKVPVGAKCDQCGRDISSESFSNRTIRRMRPDG